MKYWYWIIGVVMAGGIGAAGYYYGPDLLGTSTKKNIEDGVSQPESSPDLPSSNNWDLLIQAAKAGRNAELTASVPVDTGPLWKASFLNKYKISNVASNGDVTFEYEILSVDVDIQDWVKQDMLKEGYTVPDVEEDSKAAMEELGANMDKIIGYTQKSIFTKDAFISMIEDWKVGSFAVGYWGSRDRESSSASPNYIKSLTIQCKNNDWNCLIEAADAGNNARMTASSQIEKELRSLGITSYPTNECKVAYVASNGDVDFGYKGIAYRVEFDRDFKNKMVEEGKTGIEIEQYRKELETGRAGAGWMDINTLTKASFRALIGHWKDGNFSVLDLDNYYALGREEAQSPSLDDADTNIGTRTDTQTDIHTGAPACFTEDLPKQFGNYANIPVGEKVCSGSDCATIDRIDPNGIYFSFSGTSGLVYRSVDDPAFQADNSLIVRVCQIKTASDGKKYAHVKFGKASQSPSSDNSNFIDGSMIGL